METAYLHDLYAEGLEPGQEPVQGGLVLQGAVQDGFDRLHRGVEPLEVQQGFGREDPDHADLVVGRQRSPQLSRWARAKSPRSRVRARGAPCTTGEIRHSGERRDRPIRPLTASRRYPFDTAQGNLERLSATGEVPAWLAAGQVRLAAGQVRLAVSPAGRDLAWSAMRLVRGWAGITRGGWGGAGAGLVDLGLVLVA